MRCGVLPPILYYIKMTNQTVKLDISTKKHPNTYTLIDADMYEELSKYKWFKNKGYCKRSTTKNYKTVHFTMHRVIMQAKKGEYVDHINGDRLDNRRSNLRICSNQENLCNKPKQLNNTSGYKGVTWRKIAKKWLAQIQVNNKTIHLGYYETKEEAALAYNIAAKKYHGEFACQNDIETIKLNLKNV